MDIVSNGVGIFFSSEEKSKKENFFIKHAYIMVRIICMVLLILFMFLFVTLAPSLVVKDEVYNQSFAVIKSNTDVMQSIGQPIKIDKYIFGDVGGEKSSFYYSIFSTKGKADVYVEAYKKENEWVLNNLSVYVREEDRSIQLISSEIDG